MPNTLEENVKRIKAARTAIANAITAKGGTVASGDGLEDFANDIATIPSGGGGGEPTIKNDVTFYDYDGTIVASYTASEFASLSAMPSSPSHTGLTAQGWNWTLEDAKAYVADYSKLNIGQMYVTSDGKTRIYIELTEGRLSPYLTLYLNDNSELDIDWGDGSSHSTFTSTGADYINEKHMYASTGSYIIVITVINGGFKLQSSNSMSVLLTAGYMSTQSPDISYLNAIKRIEIGNHITSIGAYAFSSCYSLTSVTIPNSITSIENNAFLSCHSLTNILIPSSITSIKSSAFQYCYSLTNISIPNSVTSIGDAAFSSCSSLTNIIIPSSVTSVASNAFSSCSSLTNIIIPSSVTSIGNGVFYGCYSLANITILSPIINIGSTVFQNCRSLSSIEIPDSVTSIGITAFSGCSSLASIEIPDSVTSIGNSAFKSCSSLTNITIPSSVTSIGSTVFSNCYSLKNIIINKPENSITGSPWGASTGTPTSTQIIWAG